MPEQNNEKTLFFHPNDTTGIRIITTLQGESIAQWFNKNYFMPPFTKKSEALNWLRKNLPFHPQESQLLGGVTIRNPFWEGGWGHEYETISDRGDGHVGRGQASFSDWKSSAVTLDEFTTKKVGTVIDVRHSVTPLKGLDLTPEQWLQLLAPHVNDISNFTILVRRDHKAPLTVGSHRGIARLASNIRHTHKTIHISG